MTRKCFPLFIILLVCVYFLLSGLFGEDGLCCEKRLAKRLENQNDLLERLDMLKSGLERQKEAIYTKEYLMDKAREFGYGAEGDRLALRGQEGPLGAPVSELEGPLGAPVSGPEALDAPLRTSLGDVPPAFLSRGRILAISLLISASAALASGLAGRRRSKRSEAKNQASKGGKNGSGQKRFQDDPSS